MTDLAIMLSAVAASIAFLGTAIAVTALARARKVRAYFMAAARCTVIGVGCLLEKVVLDQKEIERKLWRERLYRYREVVEVPGLR